MSDTWTWADKRAEGVMRVVPGFAFRRAGRFAALRVAIGIWLLILTGIIDSKHGVGWWTPLLLLAAAVHFYFAYRLYGVRRQANSANAK